MSFLAFLVFVTGVIWWTWSWGGASIFAFYYKGDNSEATIRIRLFTRKWEQRQVFGSCTVWHDANTGHRQPSYIERMLADRWALENYKARSNP